jgi:ATP-dependent DNA helicase RecQ
VLTGRDTLALLPTGGGKSICFQVPALCREGICLVVSPLIALMKDQVYQLKKRGIAAAAVYAGMSRRELDIVFENACNGGYKLLYLSPERLQTDLARERIKRMNVNLLAVDEAHCISQWGYDFRPPYLELAQLRELLPNVPVLALTATATPEVTADIQEKLAFRAPNVLQQSFARPNLAYAVLYEFHKKEKLLQILKSVPGTALVYVRSRGQTKEIALYLAQHGLPADFYHAGLSLDERSAKQQAWIDNRIRVMVCTNAFGMGIDKANVRLVVHLSMPDSPEAYFQEAGRAGRDGQKAYAVLLHAPADADTLRLHLEGAFPPLELVRRVYQGLGSYSQLAIGGGAGVSLDFDFNVFCKQFGFEHAPTYAALRLLEQDGWIALSDNGAAISRLTITADRETLYDYQLRQRTADTVVKFLLRAYHGLQSQYIEISESWIASSTNLPVETVVQILQAAQTAGIVDYLPRSEKQQLIFLHERVAAENLTFDLEKLQIRRARATARVEAAIRYAETRRCRSQQLLAYFGERDSATCGICDICTGRNKSDTPDAATFDMYARKIKQVIQREHLTLEQIKEAFAPRHHEALAQVVSYLLDEGVMEMDEAGKVGVVG